MGFEILLGCAVKGSLGDASVVPEDVGTGFLAEKLIGAFGDGGEIVEV